MGRPRGSRKTRELAKRIASGGGRFLGYIRVSTVDQEMNGHSLDGQIARLSERARQEGIELLEIVQDVKSGAKQRDGLDEVWARIIAGEAEGILFPKLDRLGRSQVHLARLVEDARDRGISLLSSDEGWQVYRGELRNETLPFLIALAQVERERISRRTKEGLMAVRAKGVHLGAVAENVSCQEEALRLRRDGMTFAEIAEHLNYGGERTARGRTYFPATVWRMVERAIEAEAAAAGTPPPHSPVPAAGDPPGLQ